jgi:hypothetical protein
MSYFRDLFEVPQDLTLEKIKKMSVEKRKKFRLKKDVEIVIRDLKRKGLSDRKIAEKIDVSEETFYQWAKIFPEFSECLKKGKEIWIAEIADVAYKTAKGYFVEEKKTVVTEHPDGKITKSYEKNRRWIAPHSGLIKYILSTQDSEFWNEKVDTNTENNDVFETFSRAVNTLTQNE